MISNDKKDSFQGWEVTVIKQEESTDGPLEMKIALPSMPSLYITSFLFEACLEIHKVGGHVLDKIILQDFAWRLMEKVCCSFSLCVKVNKLSVSAHANVCTFCNTRYGVICMFWLVDDLLFF